jgi:hypothetical protein
MNIIGILKMTKDLDLDKLDKMKEHVKNIDIQQVDGTTMDIFIEFDDEGITMANEVMPKLLKLLKEDEK